MLLDQEGLEIDEIDRMEQDTPLHKAVRYVNSLDKAVWPHGQCTHPCMSQDISLHMPHTTLRTDGLG